MIIGTVIIGGMLLCSCGESGDRRRLEKTAVTYIKEKYGINAKAVDVTFGSVGWLELKSEKSKSGTVEMTADGRTFHVYATLRSSWEDCFDDYYAPEVIEAISSVIKDTVVCEDSVLRIVYTTNGGSKCLSGLSLKTPKQVIAGIEHLYVDMSTYGLDIDSARALDLSSFAQDVQLSIHDWNDPSIVQKGYISEVSADASPNEIMHLKQLYVDDGGLPTQIRYDTVQPEDMVIVFPGTDASDIAPCDTAPKSELTGVTKWYTMTGGSAPVNIMIMYPESPSGKVYCIEIADENGSILRCPRLVGHSAEETAGDIWDIHYVFNRETIGAGETIVFRIAEER